MKNLKTLVAALILQLAACGGMQDVEADGEDQVDIGQTTQALGSVTGNIQYTNHWDPTYAGSQAYYRFANIVGTVKPLTKVKVCMHQSSLEMCGFTNDSGQYTIGAVPPGIYSLRVYWDTSDSKFRATNGLAGGNATLFSESSVLASVLSTGLVRNETFGQGGLADNQSVAYASSYAAVRAWFDTLLVTHQLSGNAYFTHMGPILIQNAVSGPTSASVNTVILNSFGSLPTNNVVWHELGHTAQMNMQLQRFSGDLTKLWNSGVPFYHTTVPNCAGPSGGTQESSDTMMIEGWADFVQYIVEFKFGPNDHPGIGNGTCLSGTSACGVSNISTANPATMPACGPGSSLRSRGIVSSALFDLVDSDDVSPLGTCFHETVAMTVPQVFFAMTEDPQDVTTAQPYGNSSINVDENSLLDFLYRAQTIYGVRTYPVWANSCFQPGKTFGALLP